MYKVVVIRAVVETSEAKAKSTMAELRDDSGVVYTTAFGPHAAELENASVDKVAMVKVKLVNHKGRKYVNVLEVDFT